MAAPCSMSRIKYLLHFANEHVDFKIHEIKSVAKIFGIDMKFNEDVIDNKKPFVVIDLPGESYARQLMSRSVLVKCIYELWAEGKNYEELHDGLRKLPKDFVKPYLHADKSFRIMVDTFNKTIQQDEKIKKIETLPVDVLDFQGKVNLKSPDNSFSILEYYNYTSYKSTEKEPQEVYFGRLIAEGQRNVSRDLNLQKRKFIANTSMDPLLSLIMANMGLVKSGSLVYDPFVGSGSLLVACAYNKAYVMGSELDYQLLHGRGKSSRKGQKWRQPDENVKANLSQYDLGDLYVDVMVADAALYDDMWNCSPEGVFDAIVTDPPYGIREGAKKIGTSKEVIEISEEQKDGHIPERIQYNLSDIFKDLLNMSAKFLCLNGRLVYWFPVHKETYTDANIPCHPCLKLVSNCEQPLNERVSRRLITMEKTAHYYETESLSKAAHYLEDSFRDMSFRDRYFTPASNGPHKSKPSVDKRTQISDSQCDANGHSNLGQRKQTIDESMNNENEKSS